MPSSYAKRKTEVAYLTQRGEELEKIIEALQERLRRAGLQSGVPLIAAPIDGDSFITDIGAGEFGMRHWR
jgi:hypothetical protein